MGVNGNWHLSGASRYWMRGGTANMASIVASRVCPLVLYLASKAFKEQKACLVIKGVGI